MEVKVNPVLPLIESFIKRVRPEQWRLLSSGEPDEGMTFMLEDLLLDVLSGFSKNLLMNLNRLKLVSDERVFSTNGSTLIQTFSEVMDIKDLCANSDERTAWEVKENMENNNAAPSSQKGSGKSVISGATRPCRPAHEEKVTVVYTPTHSTRQSIQPLTLEDVDTEDESDEEVLSAVTFVKAEYSATAISQTIQKVVSKELIQITNPDLDDKRFESSLAVRAVADEISELIVEEVKRKGADSASPEIEEKCIRSMDRAVNKMKTFFAKQFTQSLIYCIVAELKTQFIPESKEGSEESLWSLMDSVDSLLLKETGEQEEGANDICVFRKLKEIASGQTFKQRLTDLLYTKITQIRMLETLPKGTCRKTSTTMPAHRLDVNLYSTILSRVQSCLERMDSWLNTEVSSLSEKVILTVMETEPISTRQLPKVVMEEEDYLAGGESGAVCEKTRTAHIADRKAFVRTLVKRLVARTFKKAKVHSFIGAPEVIITPLFEKTWAEVESIDFDDSPEAFKVCDKTIFKELCKKCGRVEILLLSMKAQNTKGEKDIISCLKHHLTQPKQPSSSSRLFSSVGKTISNVFRWRNSIGV